MKEWLERVKRRIVINFKTLFYNEFDKYQLLNVFITCCKVIKTFDKND